jgi:hypothetical protein
MKKQIPRGAPPLLLLALLWVQLFTILLYSCTPDNTKPPNSVYGLDQDSLPVATMVGRNVFGCLLNGRPYIPQDPLPSSSAYPILIAYNDPPVINIESKCNFYEGDEYILTSLSVQIIPNKIDTTITHFYMWHSDFRTCRDYVMDTMSPYEVKITKVDKFQNIVSGLFSGTLISGDCDSDTLLVTKGRFDLRLSW